MKQLLATLSVVAVLATFVDVSEARGRGGHSGAGGHGHGGHGGRPAVQGQRGFQGHRGAPGHHHGFSERRFGGHHHHRGAWRGHGGVFFGAAPFVLGPAFAYGWTYDPGYVYSPPVYSVPAPSYWYYCPSAGGYYPDVPTCPEPWVPVPAQ